MSKSFKKLVAIVSAIAMVIAGITVQPQTANAAEALEWSELTDGLGKATIKDTSTEEVRGAEYKGFETDRSWGGDSKWQGQAKVNDVTVEAGQAYKVSLDVSSTPAKKILVQTLSGGEYVEKEYDTTVGHIEQTFVANNDKVNIIVAFGSFSDDEVGTYDVSISNLKLEKTEKSEEQIEKERVEALLTGDKNIAKGKKAFSNSVQEKDYQPEEAFDGNLGLRYAAASYESGVTLGVDLGKTYKVSSVAFKWENAYATEYNIQVSKDGKAYDTVKTMTADKAETIEVPLDEAVEARYVRIECVKNALNYGYSLWEMGVYGTEVAEVETTTPVVEPGTGETTTPAKQDETTTSAKQDETTTPAPVVPTVPVAAEKDWSAEDFISSSDATYNDTYKAIKDGAINEIVNIQPADDTLGLYVSFADADFGTITVNGKAADIKVAGAGIWFKLSNFTDMYSDVVITNGAGTVKATLYVYRRRYEPVAGHSAHTVVGNANDLEWMSYEGMENCYVQDFLPSAHDIGFDMNMHILKFHIGASHGYIETHVQQHGMYFLSGKSMYRLGDDWVPLQKGDYCFMDAYVPQACYAVGDEGREEELVYIYSKDCNRDIAL